MANTLSKYSSLIIDSRDRGVNSVSSTNFSVSFKESIDNIYLIDLKYVNLPNSFYNITAANNNIYFSIGATNYSCTIAPGNYSVTTIMAAIATAMNGAINNSFAATYNAITMRITITGTSAFVLQFSNAATPYRELGWPATNTSSATSQLAPNVPQLSSPLNLYLYIPDFGRYTFSSSGIISTFTIPINAAVSPNIYQQQDFNQTLLLDIESLTNFSVRLMDNSGNIMDLGGEDWQFCLGITCKK